MKFKDEHWVWEEVGPMVIGILLAAIAVTWLDWKISKHEDAKFKQRMAQATEQVR